MDKQLYILLILHFAVKHKDNAHSSEDTFLLTGLTQNKISQYFTGKCAMPRSSRIALAQHIMSSLKIKKATYLWLDEMNMKYLDNEHVKNLIDYIEKNGKLSPPRGRTVEMSQHILKIFKLLNESEQNSIVK